jgi:sortase A
VWGLARIVGGALEQRDLNRFRAADAQVRAQAPPAPTLAPVDPRAADQRLWAVERIHAYARALHDPGPSPLAVLRIPRIGLEVPVLAGTDEWTLDRAVGWVEGTARPGETGNVGIAGHRDGFFRSLKDVRPGDALELAIPGGSRSYRVDRIRVVHPHDVRDLESTALPTVTLITCYPFYFVGSAPERYIVRATLADAQATMAREDNVPSR